MFLFSKNSFCQVIMPLWDIKNEDKRVDCKNYVLRDASMAFPLERNYTKKANP